MEIDEKILIKIIENQDSQNPDYILEIDQTIFHLQNVLLTRSSTPVNRPTTRGGVYFSDKFEFKIKAQVNDFSIIPLLSKCMLGPNTEFQELKIITKFFLNNSLKRVTFFVNLTNNMKSSSHVELNMMIIRVDIENLS